MAQVGRVAEEFSDEGKACFYISCHEVLMVLEVGGLSILGHGFDEFQNCLLVIDRWLWWV